MNVTPVSNLNFNVNTAINAQQPKATNPFLMKNDVDTFEFSAPKNEVPSSPMENAKERLKEGFSNANETFRAHVAQGFETAAKDAETLTDPTQAMSVSHVAANTAFIGQAIVGTGAAIAEIAKGIAQAFKALV